jgi:hypothetical protein
MTSPRPVRIGFCFLLSILALASKSASGQNPGAKAKPDYRNPARAFSEVKRGSRTFTVEKQLLDENLATAIKALDRLNTNIDLALSILPRHAHKQVAILRWNDE